jgi:multidrug efflux system membrane fusion protein
VSRRPKGRSVAVATGAVVALGLTAGAVVLATGAVGSDGDDTPPSTSGAAPPATTTVTRRDLVATDSTTGTLGYGDTTSLANHRQGTVTWVPAEGRVVQRGQALWRVDTLPTVLMYGTIPMYRTLSSGVDDGADVRQLERNLRALGYTGFTVDDRFTSATASAVEDWQDDVGLPETGSVDADQVVFSPAAVRVDTRKLAVGSAAAPGPALDVTATAQIVTVPVTVSDQRLARKGAAVQVALPDGQAAGGRITSVGDVAHSQTDAQGNDTGEATIDVTVVLDAKALDAAKGAIDQSPVTVNFTADQRKNVLTVPVAALLALREGGYGVQVVSGGTTKIVAVQVGLFADGDVEVSGDGVAEGMRVGVPAS